MTNTMQKQKTNSSPDHLAELTKSSYDDETKKLLAWLLSHGEEQGLSLSALAHKTGISPTTLSRVVRGIYESDPSPHVTAIRNYQRSAQPWQTGGAYVQTSLADQVHNAARYARINGQIVTLIGESQQGKTWAAKAYVTENKQTLYIRCSITDTPLSILRKIASQLGGSKRWGKDVTMEYVTMHLTDEHLIIVDEVHQLLVQGKNKGKNSVEIIREVYDETHCSVLMIATPVWADHFSERSAGNDDLWQGIIRQTLRRGRVARLNTNMAKADISKIWTHYGMPDPTMDQYKGIALHVKHEGLGQFCKTLRDAIKYAQNKGQSPGWTHYDQTRQMLDQMAAVKN